MNVIHCAAERPSTLPIGGDAPDSLRAARDERRRGSSGQAAQLFAGESARELFTPDVDVTETHDAYVFTADVPGIRESDLEITLAGDRLILSGRREEARHLGRATYFASERSYGSFRRRFVLPAGAEPERLVTDLRDGVLTIRIPRRGGAPAGARASR